MRGLIESTIVDRGPGVMPGVIGTPDDGIARPAFLSPLGPGPSPARWGRDVGCSSTACFHCGEACADSTYASAEKVFCCQGCLFVHDLLAENGLEHFYALDPHAGTRIRQ